MTTMVQVIGFGPAALGLPLAADRLGELDRLAAEGIAFVERAVSPAAVRATRFPFVIESNSPARDFLAGIRPDGRFGAVLDRQAARRLAEHGDHLVPLVDVREFLADVAEEITGWLRGGAGRVGYGRAVHRIRRNADGTFTSLCRAGRPVVRSDAVVLATGATEDTAYLDTIADRMVPSAGLLAGDVGPVERAIRTGAPVAIVGGSHSGFATADLLLRRFGDVVRPGQISVVHRAITLCFPNLAEFTKAKPSSTRAPSVCLETGAVNRFTGLRGSARRLYTAVVAGAEGRVSLCPAGTSAADRVVAQAAVVVHARGYRCAVPELLDADGTPIPVVREDGYAVVDRACQVLGADGVYGLGIGFARRGASAERRVALNVFHGQDAEDIVRSLLDGLRGTQRGGCGQHGQSHR